MPVTMLLLFRAVAEQGHSLFLGKVLEEAEGEFLAMIFDPLVSTIDSATLA